MNIQSGEDNGSNTASSLIQIIRPKSYGSVVTSEVPFQKLIYTWTNIDVFGEAPQQTSAFSAIKSKVKLCFGKDHKVPTPRKHLLKNVAGIAQSGELLAVLGSRWIAKIFKSFCFYFKIYQFIIVYFSVEQGKQLCSMLYHFVHRPVFRFHSRLFELWMVFR